MPAAQVRTICTAVVMLLILPVRQASGQEERKYVKMAGFYTKRKKTGKKKIHTQAAVTAVLMLLSFAAGALTYRALTRPPQTDAGLTYIEEIPVVTDFLPEGCRARPGEKREIKYLVLHETDNFSAGADAAAHNSFIHQNANAPEGIVSWHYTVDDRQIYHHLPDDENAYHAGDRMEKNGGNLNGIGIEMCVNEGSNYEQTLRNAQKLCARLLIEYDLKPGALRRHQDFSGKVCPARLIESGRWDAFCAAVEQRYRELKSVQ